MGVFDVLKKQNKTQKMGPHVAPTLWEEETANTKVVRQQHMRDVWEIVMSKVWLE